MRWLASTPSRLTWSNASTRYFAIGNAVHPAEASDLCALNARRTISGLRSWLNDGEWVNNAVTIHVQSPVVQTWPSLVSKDDVDAKMLVRVSNFVEPPSQIVVRQAGQTLWTTNRRRAIVANRSLTVPMHWANLVDPTIGDVQILID